MKKTFEEWLRSLDIVFYNKTGMSYMDGEDYMWRDLYDEGYTPLQAYKEFAENADWY